MSESASVQLKTNVYLGPYNTLGIEARAHKFISVTSVGQLQDVLRDPEVQSMPQFILGGGSNVLFAGDYRGCVIHMKIRGKEVVDENQHQVEIKVGAGENWHETVLHCVGKGWGGIENLSLIPGTVGAAPIQNIGAYGVELEEVFVSLDAVEAETGNKRTFTKEDCQFGYRDSIFKNDLKGKFIVTDVTLRLCKQPELNTSYGAIRNELERREIDRPTIKDVSDIVIDIRNSKLPDPRSLGNAGSFFKNPIVDAHTYQNIQNRYDKVPGYPADDGMVKVPAGWLIEQTGWKGKVVGKTGTYKQQALVIVNHGGATGKEILDLAGEIRASVEDEFGIELVPEVNIVN